MKFFNKFKISENLLAIVAFANIYIIWGSTFLAMSFGLLGFPAFLLSGFRFLAAGSLLFGWRIAMKDPFPTVALWRRNAIVGILILTGGTGLVAWAEQFVSATEAAVAIATGPFWFIAIDRKNWNRYFTNPTILPGLVAGFGGLLIFLNGSVDGAGDNHGSMRLLAFGVLALSSVSWVLGSLYSRNNATVGTNTVSNIAQQLLVAGTASLLVATVRGEWSVFRISAVPLVSWAALLFLVLMGSVVAYLSYIWLLTVRNPAQVSTHTYINPVVAVLVGWLFTRELISCVQLTGLLTILCGVILTNTRFNVNKRAKVRIRNTIRTSLLRLYIIEYVKKGY